MLAVVHIYKYEQSCVFLFRSVIENDQISLSAKLGVFTIVGTTGNAHAVRLFPKESCTCPSTGLCYHIVAAKLSIGLNVTTKSTRVNLSQLRRNTRAKKDKTSGRKKPRVGDCFPAPDSLAMLERNSESVSEIKLLQ